MAQSLQNSQPRAPAQVPRRAPGAALESSAAPHLHRAPGSTAAPALPSLSLSFQSAPSASCSLFASPHIQDKPRPVPDRLGGQVTVSCCHIQLITDIGGQLPGPSPHARNGGTKAGADGSTAAVGTLLLLSRFIFCRPSLRRPGHKAPPVLSDPREQRRNCLLTASQEFLLCSRGIRESGRWPHSHFLEASHPLVSQGHLKVFCRDPD